MPVSSFSLDAVIFDLDGTLVATERYWPDAARAATLALASELGLQRDLPSTAEWLEMVGRPMDVAFTDAFPELDSADRELLIQACAKAEREQLAHLGAAPLPFAETVLDELRRRGVRVGVASNCGFDYLHTMMDTVGLGRWVEEARCLQSPGVRTKSDMIADILLHFGVRSAAVVGDRRGDRDAAWENGLPFIHIPRGYGGQQEEVAAEATLDGLDPLLPLLGQRDQWIRDLLARIPGANSLGVVGLPLAGKTLLAADIRRVAQEAGRALEVLDDPVGTEQRRCEATVALTASEDVLVRRARGLRLGVGPVEELMGDLPAARARLAALEQVLLVDGDNLLNLKLISD